MSAAATFKAEGREDDFLDWLAGDDDAIAQRHQDQRRSVALAGGAEIG